MEGGVYGESRAVATANAGGMIKAMADQCGTTKFGIIGYSQVPMPQVTSRQASGRAWASYLPIGWLPSD